MRIENKHGWLIITNAAALCEPAYCNKKALETHFGHFSNASQT